MCQIAPNGVQTSACKRERSTLREALQLDICNWGLPGQTTLQELPCNMQSVHMCTALLACNDSASLVHDCNALQQPHRPHRCAHYLKSCVWLSFCKCTAACSCIV